MTLEDQTKLIDELIVENPDATIKEFVNLMKDTRKGRAILVRLAQIKLNRICEERYRTFKSDYAQIMAR